MAVGSGERIGGIHESGHVAGRKSKKALQHAGHLFLGGTAIAGDGHFYLHGCIFVNGHVVTYGCGNGDALRTPEL